MHIKESNKIIGIKDLWIFENYESKTATNLPTDNENIPAFQRFFSGDENDDDKEKSMQARKSQKINIKWFCKGRKINAEESYKSQKVNTEQPHKS